MTAAPSASVAAVQKALGCERIAEVDDDSGPYAYCETHDDGGFGGVFTDRGCPVAVAAADAAVQALGLTWERGSDEVPGRSRWQRLVGQWQGPRP